MWLSMVGLGDKGVGIAEKRLGLLFGMVRKLVLEG